MNRWKETKFNKAFTIVELVIVIAVIAVLTVTVIIGYGSVVNNTHDTAVKSDLQKIDDAFKQFALDSGGTYPKTYTELGSLGIKVAGGSYSTSTKSNMYLCLNAGRTEYAVIAMSRSQKRFMDKSEQGVSEYTGSVAWTDVDANMSDTCTSIDSSYQPVNDITGMVDGQWLSWTGADNAVASVICPTGYIVVPGNALFGTDDFCVMKYEAKNVGGFTKSEAAGTPWVSITQDSAIATATAACTGCHLITEAEWMTVAANVLSVPSNWSSGVVGTGYVFNGHNNNNPATGLAASTDDGDSLYGITGGTGASSSYNNPRTLTLTNGEVIWDFAGNIWEWTTGTIAGGQQPGISGESAYAWKQWNNGSLLFNGLPSVSRPSAISGTIAGYSSTQGIGQLYSKYSEAGVRGFIRGGDLGSTSSAGVLTLNLSISANDSYSGLGFRVTK